MRILFIGDIVGSPGRKIWKEYMPRLVSKYKPDVTIVNAENSSGGKGLTKKVYHELLEAGADILTMGNHMWDKKEIFDFIDDAEHVIRPANFPEGTPGKGMVIKKVRGKKLAVINLQGRTFMNAIDCPFRKADDLLSEVRQEADITFIDFHAEATSEKLALAWYLDGRATAVVGTHTHVPTADNRVLPNGLAYITDVGMTGPYDGILGVEREAVIQRFLTNLPTRFEVTKGREQLNGVVIDTDSNTGKATSIKRIHISDDAPFFD
ncbi:TIGR00282 family metallophosphoesterase [Paenalkalicoccus suaedae]|uniref:TIGR00282 family metallophosphoesterase n=1 Tax=Paenalkalicoccus suaedae TaxID=2592382 RepID=A0A859FGM4_9BACI|nr:TIGR00282 family metallophosphoesterase [Paenalkalicoccus suaedae]QKS71366.1 TIGR00282 family metallophosphoesterase [Paenalkalicoccus suaedae]